MHKITKWTLCTLSAITLLHVTADADASKGLQIFDTKLKVSCRITGINNAATFATQHTQDEWESIKQAGKFSEEMLKICPKASDKLNPRHVNDVYDFSYEYASDSGKIPNC